MTLAVTPAAPVATVDACIVAVSSAAHLRDPDNTGGEFRCYLTATGPSGQVLKSHEFAPSPEGDHQWDNLIFDEAGSWALVLHDAEDDSTVESDSVTVS